MRYGMVGSKSRRKKSSIHCPINSKNIIASIAEFKGLYAVSIRLEFCAKIRAKAHQGLPILAPGDAKKLTRDYRSHVITLFFFSPASSRRSQLDRF